MRDTLSKEASPNEMKLRTRIKTYYTTLEEGEEMHWVDKLIMLFGGVLILCVVLVVAIAS